MKQNQVILAPEVIKDENIYSQVWLPFGDDKETDITRLIKQNRIRES